MNPIALAMLIVTVVSLAGAVVGIIELREIRRGL